MQDIPGDPPALGNMPAATAMAVLSPPTVDQLLAWAAMAMPRDAYKLGLVVKRLLPFLVAKCARPPDVPSERLAGTIPAEKLFDCLSGKKKNLWSPSLLEALPEFGENKTLMNDYRRVLVRGLNLAVKKHFLTEAALGVAPAWQAARQALLEAGLPCSENKVRKLLEEGRTDFYGIALVSKPPKPPLDPETIKKFCWSVRDGFNLMGRWMTERGIDAPDKVRTEHIYGPGSYFEHQHGQNREALTTSYYRARVGWAILGQLGPYPDLATWPTPRDDNQIALEEHEYHPRVLELIATVRQSLEIQKLESSTLDNVEVHLRRYFGWMIRKRGWNIDHICAGLDVEELAWLFLGGLPPTKDGREPALADEVAKILSDESYRESLVTGIIRIGRRHEANGSCRRNPFVTLYVEWYATERGSPSGAEVFIKRARTIVKRHLRVHKSQVDWLTTLYGFTAQTKAAKPPSSTAKRKDAAGDDHELWLKLVAARPRLAARSAELKTVWTESGLGPDSEPAIKWALSVGNALMVGLLLALQLRSKNIREMKFDEDLFPDAYKVSIPPFRAKAKKRIIRNFPQRGPMADLMALLDTYLREARPILLAGRPDPPYVFVGHPKRDASYDAEGHLMIGRDRLAKTLKKVSEVFFADLFPEGLDLLSPHLARHVLTGYARRLENGDVIACQSLANTIQTVNRNYLTISRTRDDDALELLENLDTKGDPNSRSKGLRKRKDYEKEVRAILGALATDHYVNQLLAAHDRCR